MPAIQTPWCAMLSTTSTQACAPNRRSAIQPRDDGGDHNQLHSFNTEVESQDAGHTLPPFQP